MSTSGRVCGTYSAYGEDLAGNVSGWSNTLAIMFDSVAPVTPVLDLPASEDSGFSSSDNVTRFEPWHFYANVLGEQGFLQTREIAPAGRDQLWTIPTTAAGGPCCGYFFYPDVGGGLGVDQRQGVWTYSAYGEDLAGNVSAWSNTLAITFDSVAPVTPVLDLPASEDSGFSSSDNVTRFEPWHFYANVLGEQGFLQTREIAPAGRDQLWTIPTTAAGGPCCGYFFYPDVGGGLGVDQRQGVWTYSAYGEDLAGNVSAWSNTLAITFDSVAPVTPVLDLPASEDSGFSSSDNVTRFEPWHFYANVLGEQGFLQTREIAPAGRDQLWTIPTTAAGGPCCGYFFYPDVGGGLGVDQRQGVWTYSAYGEDLAGNVSAWSNTLAITFDSVAPVTPVLDLPASEDSGFSSSDNVTRFEPWHFYANVLGEQGFLQTREIAPAGRDQLWTIPTTAAGGPCCGYFFYPDVGGGLGVDQRQGVWTYSAYGEDLAGNVSAWSNTLAITFDSVAPDGAFTINNGTPVLNGMVATANALLTLQLSFNSTGSALDTMALSTDGGATYGAAQPYAATAAALLVGPDGEYTVAVRVTDWAGNTFTTTKQVRLDRTGPVITPASPLDGRVIDVSEVITFQYGTSDVSGVASSSATLDGHSIANGGSIDAGLLSAGAHTITITATDALGNGSARTITFRVEATIAGLIHEINEAVADGEIAANQQNALLVKLNAAQAALDGGNISSAQTNLQDLINLVNAQTGKKISVEIAGSLVDWVTDLIGRLSPVGP